MREALYEVLGEVKAEFFFDKVRMQGIVETIIINDENQYLEYFFAEADAKFFSSLGLNCIRIGIGYHHFEGDYSVR